MQNRTERSLFKHTLFERYAFIALLAMEVLMSFTFLGYIHIPPVSITLAYIPVVAAGCLFGTGEATLTGLVFGLASMYKASANYVMPSDQIFSPVHGSHPVESILLSIGTRVLFGALVGLAFAQARRAKHFTLWRVVISLLAPKLHAVLVVAAMVQFFPEQGEAILQASSVKLSDLPQSLLCVLLVELLWSALHCEKAQRFQACIDRSSENPYVRRELAVYLRWFIALLLGLSLIAAVYFSQRAVYMLGQHHIAVSDGIGSDLLHLQIQFVAATMSLIVVMAVLRQLAQRRETAFTAPGLGIVGRLGGDEFAVLIEKPMTEQELGRKLDEFQTSLSGILPAPNKVTSSIGGCHFTLPQDVYALIDGADVRLYEAKHNGRAGYVLGEL